MKRETVANAISWLVILLAGGCILSVVVWSVTGD